MFEGRSDPLISRGAFARRMAKFLGIVLAIIAVALAIGVVGYHAVAGLSWIDSLLNASMILSAMGPVDRVSGDAAKLFASCYALFSGIVFITSLSVLASPIFHRLMHRFHVDDDAT